MKIEIQEEGITEFNDSVDSSNSIFDNGRFVKSFENIILLDKGGFGCVYKAQHKIDNNDYAVKLLEIKVHHETNA
jgi:serine/threonine protein kinase